LAGPGSTANSITQAYRKGQARVATNNVTGVQLGEQETQLFI